MSGGSFQYDQYKIGYIADQIEEVIVKNGVEKTPEDLKQEGWRDPEWYTKYPEDKFHYKYPDEVIEKMKEAVKALKIAQEYAQRVDWLLSGDDGEESFLSRLEENLKKIE
jgi:MoxR-like ATPase